MLNLYYQIKSYFLLYFIILSDKCPILNSKSGRDSLSELQIISYLPCGSGYHLEIFPSPAVTDTCRMSSLQIFLWPLFIQFYFIANTKFASSHWPIPYYYSVFLFNLCHDEDNSYIYIITEEFQTSFHEYLLNIFQNSLTLCLTDWQLPCGKWLSHTPFPSKTPVVLESWIWHTKTSKTIRKDFSLFLLLCFYSIRGGFHSVNLK